MYSRRYAVVDRFSVYCLTQKWCTVLFCRDGQASNDTALRTLSAISLCVLLCQLELIRLSLYFLVSILCVTGVFDQMYRCQFCHLMTLRRSRTLLFIFFKCSFLINLIFIWHLQVHSTASISCSTLMPLQKFMFYFVKAKACNNTDTVSSYNVRSSLLTKF